MKWIKKGWIYTTPGTKRFSRSHAQAPFPYKIAEDRLRVFFATRDECGRSSVAYVDVSPSQPNRILQECKFPSLQYGQAGCFDDSGTMPPWFVPVDGAIWLYYTGWNRSEETSYRLSIGLAVS